MLSDGTRPFRKQRDTSRYQFEEIKQRNTKNPILKLGKITHGQFDHYRSLLSKSSRFSVVEMFIFKYLRVCAQVHTLEVFQKELNESEHLVFQAVHGLQRALQGDYRDVVNVKESSRQRLEALREAAIKVSSGQHSVF